ncbi:MAG: hypothetical protein AAF670_18415 [Planctomycetota bacterium]
MTYYLYMIGPWLPMVAVFAMNQTMAKASMSLQLIGCMALIVASMLQVKATRQAVELALLDSAN